nr:hypothetical protein [Candidatus Brachybacter algidus]
MTDTLKGCPSSISEVITLLEQPSKPTEISISICPKEFYLLPSGRIVHREPGFIPTPYTPLQVVTVL